MRPPLRITLGVGAVGLVAVAVAGAATGFGGGQGGTGGTGAPILSTAPVTRTTLTQTKRVSGTVGHGAPVTVTGRGAGVVTWLPAPGAVIRRGAPVYRADNRPVPLFYGGLPLYRPLGAGDTGPDVREVEQNLAALGYRGLTVDTRYTAATATAVRRWQRDLGLARTGTLSPADVVVAAGELRVATLAVPLGGPADGPILAYTGTTRTVRVHLDVSLQELARPGNPATVTLPNGRKVDGTVREVGSVATATDAGGNAAEGSAPATVEVTVTVPDQAAFGTLTEAPVAVELVAARVENAVTVPVGALVALAGGGYGVQVVTGSTSRYVPVELGMFANGRVQVTGEGIAEGTLVGVPS